MPRQRLAVLLVALAFAVLLGQSWLSMDDAGAVERPGLTGIAGAEASLWLEQP